MSIDTPSTEPETESSTTTPRTGSTTFITTSGGLLTDELVSKFRQRQCRESAVRPETFALPNTEPPEETDLEAEIGDTWDTLRERWDELTMDEMLFHMDVSDARNKWILKLFQNFGFEPVFQRENLEAGGIEANLSHKGWPDGEIENYGEMEGRTVPILHTVEPEQKLDEKPEDAPRGAKSPHDTLQEFLNASDEHDWAVVTNGLTFRILRDFYHTYTRGYVEFDLENMFTSRNYGDFRALYRLCHATRFIEPVVADDEDDDVETPLEQLYQVALSTGVKVGQDLQSNVVSAIETLGTGLLNQEIREFLEEGGEEEAKEYYQEVLLLVYRLLFLMYAEQRGMMASRDSLYTDEYSITNLREKAETRRSGSDRNTDLWHGLQSTFRLVEKGDDELGVPCYNGMLFDSDRLEWVSESECSNDDLLDAIEDLTLIEHEGTRQRISYADLGVEEIGSVYESLLEFTPRLASEVIELEDRTVSRGEFYLDDRGTERKETGSYYTDPGLVRELVQSALKPVVEDRLDDAATIDEQENALLNITVCDPASGSGAFLIAANNFLAQRLARIRADSDYPPEEKIREARRDVLQHCIYAVDLNPMAVELAKVSLWINSAVEDKPLNFLDHHIKCGNSLIGTNSELLDGEFPMDAYETSGGCNWHVGNDIRKRVRSENKERSKGSSESSLQRWGTGKEEYVDIAKKIDTIEEESTQDIEQKKQLYDELRRSDVFEQEKLVYNIWTAAFYWPMDGSVSEYPSPSTIGKIRRNPNPDDEDLQDLINTATEIAEQQRFFHWELEFPSVYSNGGFDCLLGNPPWDKITVEETKFFATKAPEIANKSLTQSEREDKIGELEEKDPELYREHKRAIKNKESKTKFIKESGRFPLSSHGILNLYAPFSELALKNIDNRGRSGIVVPTGIATASNTQEFFREITDSNRIDSLLDFENRNRIFPDVHGQYKFCLLTLVGESLSQDEFDLAFYLTEVDHLHDDSRRYQLSPEDIQRVNPNTGNCPVFRNKEDAELVVSIYKNSTIIKHEGADDYWDIEISRMFNAGDDSHLFERRDELQEDGLVLDGHIFKGNTENHLPVYESKMFHQFDHRYATYEGVSKEDIKEKSPRKLSSEEKNQSSVEALPPYWIAEDEYNSKWNDDTWHIALRGVTNVTNRRTTIASLLPRVASEHTLNHILHTDGGDAAVLVACLNSFVLDYVTRRKLGNEFLSHFVIKQLPVPKPKQVRELLIDGEPAIKEIKERVLKLTYTSDSLEPFAQELGYNDGPFDFTNPGEKTREEIRFELEAIICHLYGIESEDFERIFDDFEQVESDDLAEYGHYKTHDEIKAQFEELAPRVANTSEVNQ